MRGLWQRRAFRHLTIGLAPLLVVGTVLIVALSAQFAAAAAPVREATAEATATITRSGLDNGNEVELRWTDSAGDEHLSRVRVPNAGRIRTGSTVTLQYVPSDPARVYVGGDATYLRLRTLGFDAFLVALVMVLAVAVSAVHVGRRLAAERRPGHTVPATYARSRRGLIHRGWLLLADADRDWWVPVHWEPVLASTLAKTPCTVHGRPLTDRVVVVEVQGKPVWQSGRKRPVSPRGEVITTATPWSKAAQRRTQEAQASSPASIGRHLRADAALLAAAPLLGLLWAYLDGSGMAGFAGGTVLIACLLFWLPSMFGSDPT
jgi:hypothetical protein